MRPSVGALLALFLSGVGCGVQVVTAPASRTTPAAVAPPTLSLPPSSNAAPLRAAGREHLAEGRLDAAIQTLESAYRLDPADLEGSRLLCEAYNQRAVVRYSDDRLQGAITDLQRSLELDSSQTEIRMQLMRAQARLQRLNAIGQENRKGD